MGNFVFSNTVSVKSNRALDNRAIIALWNGSTRTSCKLDFEYTDNFTLCLGNVRELTLPTLTDGKEFAVTVNDKGAAVNAADYSALARAFLTLIMQIEPLEDGRFMIKEGAYSDSYCTHKRMIHLCVFPETPLLQLKRLVRLVAVMQYTHVVIEFWGMLKYDCQPMLSWENAYEKNEVAPIIEEARMLGCEPIPMFNMLGHAAGCRMCTGKHVALDREPSLFYLFTPDGWAWNPDSEAAVKLLANVRRELYELFGEGEYIHIGCDECWQRSSEYFNKLPKYFEELTTAVINEGRRPIMWGDMLLYHGISNDRKYCCNAENAEMSEKFMASLAEGTVIVDWQYDMAKAPLETSLYLKSHGFEVLGGPWYSRACGKAHIDTLKSGGTDGLMLTTWHTLTSHMISIPLFAKYYGAKLPYWFDGTKEETATAAILRRLLPDEKLGYAEYGWQERQIGLPEW